MAYINDTNFDKNLFNYYTPFYNHFWLLYITDLKLFDEILNKYNSNNDYMTIYGIIIPAKFKDKILRNFNKLSPSIFTFFPFSLCFI